MLLLRRKYTRYQQQQNFHGTAPYVCLQSLRVLALSAAVSSLPCYAGALAEQIQLVSGRLWTRTPAASVEHETWGGEWRARGEGEGGGGVRGGYITN